MEEEAFEKIFASEGNEYFKLEVSARQRLCLRFQTYFVAWDETEM